MIWLAWRLHRSQIITIAALAAAGTAFLLYMRLGVTSYITTHDLAGCIDKVIRPESCLPRTQAFQDEFSDLTKYVQASLLPLGAILGMFCGAPLFARELEQGTHVLALTQAVSRSKWFAVKVAMAIVPAIIAAGILTAALWSFISAQGYIGVKGQGLFNTLTFDTSGLAPAAHTVFAVAVGITIGVFSRHTITAMAGTLGAFAVARFAGDTARGGWLNLLPTERLVVPVDATVADGSPDMKIMHTGYMTKGGQILSDEGPLAACIAQNHRDGDPTTCYPKLGITQHYADVIGGGQYWTAQIIEAALFVGVSAALLIVSVALLRKRSL